MLPHRVAAWVLLAERTRQAAAYCEPGAPCDPEVTETLSGVRASLNAVADSLAAHLPPRDDDNPPAPAGDRDTLLARARDYCRTGGVPGITQRTDDEALSDPNSAYTSSRMPSAQNQ